MSQANGQLPDGWNWRKLAELGRWIGGGTPSKQQDRFWVDGTIPWVSPKDMKKVILEATEDRITEDALANSAAKRFPPNSIAIVVRSGILEHTLPVALVPFEGAANQDIKVLTPSGPITPRWLLYALLGCAEEIRQTCRKDGTTVASIDFPQLKAYELPIPPVEEQQRIAAAVEQRLNDLDAAVGVLQETVPQLELYRASLLEDACFGMLLGEDRKRDSRTLPNDWRWAELQEFAADGPRSITDGPFGSNLKTAHYTEKGPRVIRLQNIGDGVFLDAEAHIAEDHYLRLRDHDARPGDVVIAALGTTLPRACVVPEWLGPAIVKADCPRVRPREDVDPDFLVACLNSPPVRRQATKIIHGIGRPRLNLKEIKTLRLPMAPIDQQRDTMDCLRERLSALLGLTEAATAGMSRSEQLRHAILQAAFSRSAGSSSDPGVSV
jgi:type I restriction enzyme S subunit